MSLWKRSRGWGNGYSSSLRRISTERNEHAIKFCDFGANRHAVESMACGVTLRLARVEGGGADGTGAGRQGDASRTTGSGVRRNRLAPAVVNQPLFWWPKNRRFFKRLPDIAIKQAPFSPSRTLQRTNTILSHQHNFCQNSFLAM